MITTATDANGLFAVDEWAKKQNCAVWETPPIKFVSGALLAGKTVRYASPWAIAGTPPAGVAEAEEPSGADFALTMTPQGNALHLIPRIGVLGVGCKRGTTAAQLEAAFVALLPDTPPEAAQRIAREILAAIENHQWPLVGRLTLSAGVTALRPTLQNGTEDSDTALLRRSDEALYQSKNAGRNQVHFVP